MTLRESFSIMLLDGISKGIKHRLAEVEVSSIRDIVVRGEMNISESTGLSLDTCRRLCNKARSTLEQKGVLHTPFTSGINKRFEAISFGSKSLDNLLGGLGVRTGAITELFGGSNVGKTQLCHTLCVMVQLPLGQGGLNGSAIYIDTESSFTPERIYSIAEARGLDKEKASKNVIVARPMSSLEQEHYMERAGSVIDRHENIKLLVIDSVISLYRAEYIGRAALPERQQRLYRHMQMLRRISEVYRVAVVVTNQVNQTPEELTGPIPKPTGGNIMAHASTYRIRLRQFDYRRLAELIHSPYLPEDHVHFGISAQGTYDVQDPQPLS